MAELAGRLPRSHRRPQPHLRALAAEPGSPRRVPRRWERDRRPTIELNRRSGALSTRTESTGRDQPFGQTRAVTHTRTWAGVGETDGKARCMCAPTPLACPLGGGGRRERRNGVPPGVPSPLAALVVPRRARGRPWPSSWSERRTSRSRSWSWSRARCSSSVTGSGWRPHSSRRPRLAPPAVAIARGQSALGPGAVHVSGDARRRGIVRGGPRGARGGGGSSEATSSPGCCSSARPRSPGSLASSTDGRVCSRARRTAAAALSQASGHVPSSAAPS